MLRRCCQPGGVENPWCLGKHRMRQRAEAAVAESVSEIQRIKAELAHLADDLQDEVDAIAAASEEKAAQIEEVAVRDVTLVWE